MSKLGLRRAAVLGAALAALASAVPAHSASNEVATGALSFEGPADLSAGTWQGTFTGALSGSYIEADGERIPWTLIMDNPAEATFESGELVGCSAGVLDGRVRIATAGSNQVFGAWVNEIVPLPIIGIDATFDVEWAQVGGSGAFTVTGAVVDVELVSYGPSESGPKTFWKRVVDAHDVEAGAGTATLQGDAPASCSGVLQGAATGVALPLD